MKGPIMLRPLSVLKNIIRISIEISWLFYGVGYYLLNKNAPLNQRTPSRSHISMVRLFCLTQGFSSDIASKVISFFDKPVHLKNNQGILGNFSESDLAEIIKSIDDEGYYIFKNKLPANMLDALFDFAKNTECSLRPLDNSHAQDANKYLFDEQNPLAGVYDLPFEKFVVNPDFQNLITDNSILSVAQAYLRTSPKVDFCGWWWTSAFTNVAQSNSAQLFHFDLDRFKWIKFFIFLTDVTIESGPHVFVSKSHRSGKIPSTLLKAGYARHDDETVLKHYPKEDIQVFTVPAGTILAEDTRGLHKGTPALKGSRCVLELQFSNSLFGAVTPSMFKTDMRSNAFTNYAKKHPKIFKLYPT